MNSNVSLSDAPGRSTQRLSGTRSPCAVPCPAFELTQPLSFADVERRFFAGVVTAIRGNPVPERAFADPEFARNGGDRTRSVDDEFHGLFSELRRECSFGAWQWSSSPDEPILLGSPVRK